MNILLLGSGGREHAFAWKMVQSPFAILFYGSRKCRNSAIATNVAISVTDFEAIKALVIEKTSSWWSWVQKIHW
jgi:phosphoribosylamine--glycine ligase